MELLKPIRAYPEILNGNLSYGAGVALVSAFSSDGLQLAVGFRDGQLVIWCLKTHTSKVMRIEGNKISLITWTSDSSKVIVASSDRISVWNVSTGVNNDLFQILSTVTKVQIQPNDDLVLLVCSVKYSPLLAYQQGLRRLAPLVMKGLEMKYPLIASFDSTGERIYCTNSDGQLTIFTTNDLLPKVTLQLKKGVRDIEFSRKGDWFLTRSLADFIGVYSSSSVVSNICKQPIPFHKLRDNFYGTRLWRKCCFSGTGEYVCAISGKNHNLYVWETSTGLLITVLFNNTRKDIRDLVWNPCQPTVATVADGVVSIWVNKKIDSWLLFSELLDN